MTYFTTSRWCFVIGVLLLLAACSNRIDKLPEGHQVADEAAPDGLSRAFVWLPTLGALAATVSQPYQVWIQKEEKRKSLIFEADKTDGVRLTWKTPRELEICYGQAQISRFKNFFEFAEQDSPQIYRVEIVLKKVQKLGDC